MTTTNNEPLSGEDLNNGMHASIFVKVWGDAGGGDAGRIALANYAYELGKRDAQQQAGAAGTGEDLPPTRQQAPVGESVDTPEFRHLLDDFADEGNLEVGNLEVIQFIHAWKDAQLARERQGGMRAAADYIDKKAEDYINENADAEHDTGATVWRYGGAGRDYYNSLVELAEELRLAAPAAQAQGEPILYARQFDLDGLRVNRPVVVYSDSENSGAAGAWNVPLYLGPASKADEMRDAALEEAAKVVETYAPSGGSKNYATAIRALKSTTAADNQKGGEA